MTAGLIFGQYNATPPSVGSGQQAPIATTPEGYVLTQDAGPPAGGGITWGAPTAVAVTAGPASTVLIAAAPTRRSIQIWNPTGNGQMSVDIAGGTAVLATGRPLLAGASVSLTGEECPVGAITFIGTAGESLVYQQGT